jgi:hypothetical protein
MNYGTRREDSRARPATLLLVLTIFAGASYALTPARGGTEAAAPPPQDLIRVESRLTQLEQRLYSIETSLRGLEQQVRLPAASPGAARRNAEVELLRTELDTLRLRLAEVECGLARVDERTLTPAARETRRKAEPANVADPCRLNPEVPLRLSARP